MNLLFAQLEAVPSETIKNVALIILGILGGLYYVKEIFFRKPETFPQPMQVEHIEKCATKEELENKTDDLHSRVGAVDRDSRDRDDEMRADYNEKFQALPNQIITLLRNTGNLK